MVRRMVVILMLVVAIFGGASFYKYIEGNLSGGLPPIPTPNPDYDPMEEPWLSEDPSEFELGRNWYWHNCMTCHGDVGQGLTEDFINVWPEDHQNCWAHGCHVGNNSSEGFPIPRFVPALATENRLAKFSSEQELFSYLKATHPPQSPGVLRVEEYRLITRYVLSLNGR